MKPAFLLLLIPVLAALDASAEEELRLATWNVRNYLLQNRWEDGRYRFGYPKPEREKAELHQYLLETRPDVLFLQELGSQAMMEELREDLAVAGLDYPHAIFSGLPGSRSGLALLSMRQPVETLLLDPRDSGNPDASLIRRGIQEVVFKIGKITLRTYHVHLKSRYTSDKTDPDSRRFRETELAALVEVLARRRAVRGTDEFLVIAGDFNTPVEAPLLDSIRREWSFLPVFDTEGNAWTYRYWKTGKSECLDGFWAPHDQSSVYLPVGLFPAEPEDITGSDHRLVVVDWTPPVGESDQ